MKTGIVNIIISCAVVLAAGGCSTVPVQQLSEKYDPPILSAAEAMSMIRVEVKPIVPASDVETALVSNRLAGSQ